MFPANAIDNTADVILGLVEFLSNVLVGNPFAGQLPNRSNLIFSQGCKGVSLAKITVTLASHISHIVGVSAEKQVVRIDAGRIVAGMKNILALLKSYAVRYLPQEMMREDDLLSIPRPPVSFPVFTARPEPALSIHRYIVPLTLEVCHPS